ncbi:MAG: hypothetical protein V4621_07460 [Pseudomonadota bacterium]
MKKFARNVDGRAADVIEIESAEQIAERYHPSIAEQFVEVPTGTLSGATLVAGKWINPEPVAAPVAPAAKPPSVTPPQFFMLFTLAEQVVLEEKRDGIKELKLIFKRLEDPRLTAVDMSLDSVQDMIKFSLSLMYGPATVITRFNEILTGKIS